jgi:hypothetical protein
MAIFPKPLPGGTKLYPIIGVSSVYAVSESTINSDIAANAAEILTSSQKADYAQCFFWEKFSSVRSVGFSYILFPKLTPNYPDYLYYTDREEPDRKITLFYSGTSHGYPIWVKTTSFDYNDNPYDLYVLREISSERTPIVSGQSSIVFDVYFAKSLTTIIN